MLSSSIVVWFVSFCFIICPFHTMITERIEENSQWQHHRFCCNYKERLTSIENAHNINNHQQSRLSRCVYFYICVCFLSGSVDLGLCAFGAVPFRWCCYSIPQIWLENEILWFFFGAIFSVPFSCLFCCYFVFMWTEYSAQLCRHLAARLCSCYYRY